MILCCGEALIDMLPRRSAEGEAAYAPLAGGALFNTAIALGRLGVPTGFFTGISSDFFGELLRDTLAQSHVDNSYCAVSHRPTTLAFVRLVDGQARYTFYDENTAGRMLSEIDIPAIGNDVSAMIFGAISLINDPAGAAYEALMKREYRHRVMMLDPNIRPGFIKDRESHQARIRRMVEMADIVKLSGEDLAWFGEEGETDAIVARWLEHGPRLIAITKGAEGAVAYTARHKVTVPTRPVLVADTVGAGDTFNAGLLAALHGGGLLSKPLIRNLDEGQIRAALDLGIRAASVTVSRPGANPPWRNELSL
ncbi:MAG: carbohydrate kinase family protein [Phyllobacterium sp.]